MDGRRKTQLLGRRLVVGVLGLGLGVGLTVGWSELRSSDAPGSAAPAAATNVTPIDEAALGAPRTASTAPSPEAAVEGFLAAERDGDYATSFTFLSAGDRAALGSVAGWIASHADLMPPVVGFDVGEAAPVEGGPGTAVLTTRVELEPSLDEFAGLVPDQADITWTVAEDGGGWGVELDTRVIEPLLPPDAAAVDAVAAWAASRQSCGSDGRREGEWAGEPLAFPALADDLCGTAGAVDVGDASLLPPTDATPFVAAFGGDVLTYLRAVPVSAPVPLRAVVAPIGRDWLVVGVLPG